MRTTALHSINKHSISRFRVSDHASEAFNQIADLAGDTPGQHIEPHARRNSPPASPHLRPSSLVAVETNSPVSPAGRSGPRLGAEQPSAEGT